MPVDNQGLDWLRKKSRRFLMISATPVFGLTASLLISDAAFAQTKIEQMIVTAQKRSQDIQQVPASISAFSGAGLEDRQIKTFSDLSQATPNINMGMNAAVPVISIRGVSTDSPFTSTDTTVALHIDGVYQPRPAGLNMIMADLESVEVLRGPQGTVYGRNANAGVINLITAKPTDTFEGSATIFGGSWEHYGARGYVSGPITDGISMRLSAIVDRMEGSAKNLDTGNRADGQYLYGGRLAIRLQPIDVVTIDLSFDHSYDHNSKMWGSGSAPRLGPRSLWGFTVAANVNAHFTQDPHRFYGVHDPELTQIVNAARSLITWDIDSNVSLKSVTGWQQIKGRGLFEVEPMHVDPGVPFFADNRPNFNSHTVSQEFDLNAKIWERIDLVAGLYYMSDYVNQLGANDFLPGGIPYPSFPGIYIVSGLKPQESQSKAAFLDLTLSVTDDLRVLGGIRRTFDSRQTIQQISYNLDNTDATTFLGCLAHRVPDLDYASTTFRAGVQYDFTPDIMGYVQWQDGFKTGGWNPGECDNSYKPEQIYDWEAGVKSTLFNGTVQLNLSVFDYRYANMQLNRSVGGTTPKTVIDNAASAKVRGGELEANAYITDDLKANVGVGYIHSEYGHLSAVNAASDSPNEVDISGNQIPRSPEWTFNAGLEYTMRIGDLGELTSRGEYSYTSKTFYSIFDEDLAKQDGYSVWNAIFTFTPDNCPYRFQVYGRNLTGKDYFAGGQVQGTFQHFLAYYGQERTFGAEATIKF